MKTRLFWLVLVVMVTTLLWAQQPPVPISQEPMHHLVLENEYTKAYAVEVPVGQQTMVHEHARDYVAVTIGDADIQNSVVGKPAVEVHMKDGQAGYTKGGFAHSVRNVGNTPFRNVTIEILKSPPTTPQQQANADVRGATVLVDNPSVRIIDVKLNPGDTVVPTTPAIPTLLVALTNMEMRSPQGQSASVLRKAPGEVEWYPTGPLFGFFNMHNQPVRFVLVQYK